VADGGEIPQHRGGTHHDADPAGDPQRAGRARDRGAQRAEHADGTVAHAHVLGPGHRRRQQAVPDRDEQPDRHQDGGAEVGRREGHHQSGAPELQLAQGQQAHQPRQPVDDRAGVHHERAVEQRAQVAAVQIVQIGTRVPDHRVFGGRTPQDQCDAHRRQGRRIDHRHPDQGQTRDGAR